MRTINDPIPGAVLDHWIQGEEPEGLSIAEELEIEREQEEAEAFAEKIQANADYALRFFTEKQICDMIDEGYDFTAYFGWTGEEAEAVLEHFDKRRPK